MTEQTHPPDPEFIREIAGQALQLAARRNLVEAAREALVNYGWPPIGTDEFVALRKAAVVRSTTARLTVSWPDDSGFAWHGLRLLDDGAGDGYAIDHPGECRDLPPGAACWAGREPFRWWWPTDRGTYRIRPEDVTPVDNADALGFEVALHVQARIGDGVWTDYEGDTVGAEPANDELPAIVERLKTAVAERDARNAERAGHEALLAGVECVLLDHADEIYGPGADPNIAELACRYLAVVGDAVPVEIRNAVAANAAEGHHDA